MNDLWVYLKVKKWRLYVPGKERVHEMGNYLRVGGLEAAPGRKISGYLDIEGTELAIPVTLITGKCPGKTVLVTGGIHNAEYVGIEAAIQLAEEIRPEELCGNMIIVRLVNRSGFEHRTMSMVYEDGKNLNRVFPGTMSGTTADKLAAVIVNELHKKADYYIDLHCGDGYEELVSYVYHTAAADPKTAEMSWNMARHVNVAYAVASQKLTGGSYNYAAACGIPSILIERGCYGLWSQEEVEADKLDVKNIMRFLGILNDGGKAVEYNPRNFHKVHYQDAIRTGCWYPSLHAGNRFVKGTILGQVKDYFGNVLETCVAECDGLILYQSCSLNVMGSGPMITYACICDE